MEVKEIILKEKRYVATDGTEFSSMHHCKAYESKLYVMNNVEEISTANRLFYQINTLQDLFETCKYVISNVYGDAYAASDLELDDVVKRFKPGLVEITFDAHVDLSLYEAITLCYADDLVTILETDKKLIDREIDEIKELINTHTKNG